MFPTGSHGQISLNSIFCHFDGFKRKFPTVLFQRRIFLAYINHIYRSVRQKKLKWDFYQFSLPLVLLRLVFLIRILNQQISSDDSGDLSEMKWKSSVELMQSVSGPWDPCFASTSRICIRKLPMHTSTPWWKNINPNSSWKCWNLVKSNSMNSQKFWVRKA